MNGGILKEATAWAKYLENRRLAKAKAFALLATKLLVYVKGDPRPKAFVDRQTGVARAPRLRHERDRSDDPRTWTGAKLKWKAPYLHGAINPHQRRAAKNKYDGKNPGPPRKIWAHHQLFQKVEVTDWKGDTTLELRPAGFYAVRVKIGQNGRRVA